MRVVSHPVSVAKLLPVEAGQGVRGRLGRDAVPAEASAQEDPAAPEMRRQRPGAIERKPIAGVAVDAGVTAQRVFHALSGDAAEPSLPAATRAYAKTDSLRFSDTPFTLRIT